MRAGTFSRTTIAGVIKPVLDDILARLTAFTEA